jgi:cell division protein FtsI (penicillin-binding protein 3)
MSARSALKKPQYIPVSPWRWQLMVGFICLLFALLIGRVVSLQVLETDRGYEFLQDQGEARFLRTSVIPAYRGLIADRRGEPLAVSTPVISLWANPRLLGKSERHEELASALGWSSADLQSRLKRYQGKAFMYLQRHMRPRDAQAILDRKIAGIRGQREYQRYYPAGGAAAHLVGFTNLDDRGIEGMELAYDEQLQGRPGRKQVIKDLYGEVVRDVGELEAAQPGTNLNLSIDLRLQYVAHQELQRAMTLTGADSGSVVTMDVHTGEVLALANHPFFNPNNRNGVKPRQTRNRAIVDAFEPGSVLKPLAVAAALESGQFTPDTIIDTAPGRFKVGRKVLHDPVNYRDLSIARVVAKSSQVGIVKMALQLDEQALWQMYNRLGLGMNPGTGFPGESAGILEYREHWRDIERATLAYGHGLTVTPLQLAVAYSVIANGGQRHPASLLPVQRSEVLSEPVLSPKLALQLREILEGVTAKDGTGRRARVAGFRVGGKTGTAHKASGGGYADDRYLAMFAGVAPAENPRLVTIVLINEPKGDSYHGGEVAAPVFSAVTAAALRLFNITPDRFRRSGAAG